MVGRRSALVPILVLAALAACAGGLAWFRDFCNPGFAPLAFTPEAWAEANTLHRGYMADDLLASHDLRGMTKADVVALLGPPDDDQTDLRRFRYHLGRRGRNPDCPLTEFSLLIGFDGQGKVATADIAD
jgi:hypothetical protein